MVVLLINKFFFEKGGAERYLFMQADALAERGHDVAHFSMTHPDNRPSPDADFFVSQRDYTAVPGALESLRRGKEFIRSGEAAEKLRALVRARRPDIAHLHNFYHQLTPSIIPVLRAHNIPIVMTVHDYKLVCPNYRMFAHGELCDRCIDGSFFHAPLTRCNDGSFARSLLLGIEAYVQRWSGVFDSIDRFLTPSGYMRDVLIRGGFDPRRIVHLPSFLPDVAERATASSDAQPYMLYFGRLSDEKGLETLLDAAAKCPGIPLVICGDGPMRAELERRAQELRLSVRFTGHLDKEALDGYVAGARAVVVPSEWPENAPFTVLEAAAAGVPLIVSDRGGLPELAAVVGGVVVPAANPERLADAMREMWDDAEAAAARGARGKDAAIAYWDCEHHMDALEATYAELIAKRSAA